MSLETQKGKNFYFTPLGKSYICVEDEDPMTLYNTDDEPVGNVTLYNIKVQPFVKRAKGTWGPELHCLPRRIRVYRENYVPYAVSLIFVMATTIVIAAYGLFRYFHVKKADYQFYEEQQQGQGGGGGTTIPTEDHEMTYVSAETNIEAAVIEQNGQEAASAAAPAAAPAANPFRKDPNASTNPFNQ